MRRKPKPDTRPRWNDEALPCIRSYRMPNGTTKSEVDPSYETRYRSMLMQSSAEPEWKADPTYNLRKPK